LDEYVLSSNNRKVPSVSKCLDCGITQEFVISDITKVNEFCVNVGQNVGDVDITYNVVSIEADAEFNITATYDGNTFTTGNTSFDGTLVVDKDSNAVDTVNVEIIVTGAVVLEVTVNCPNANELTIVEVVLTANIDAGKSIYPQWRYTDGAYTGSLQSNLQIFASGVNPIVSRYNTNTGLQGQPNIPTNGSTVRIISNKFAVANYDFNASQNKFRYLRTSTLYANNTSGINALVAASSTGTILGSGNYYYADVPAGTVGNYLYLIWDYRTFNQVDLCWSASTADIDYVCCECDPCSDPCREWTFQNVGIGTATVSYTDCNGVPRTASILQNTTQIICGLASVNPTVISGGVLIEVSQECGCRE
jgi:hypothetical protein